ncbi:alpha/beta hydrolase [Lacticigenium naphthae]|uniref:alpha/beta hydrolase n=1 Tax=Lacticigenium naphthae TaxID=515351 RepID=UPI00041DE8E6|nr:alpha/beta hydrolase-fold protein [Lacticigenium naphthae]
MATVNVTFQSRSLYRKVQFTAIIPTRTKSLYDPKDTQESETGPFPTLYLLHGWDGNQEDWIQNTRIVELANQFGIAVVMPAGENSFYIDHPNGDAYGQLIGEELITESRHLFPLSTSREDTWIAGLSMGGYGALRNGLKYADTFGKVAAFSSRVFRRTDKKRMDEQNAIDKRLKAALGASSYAGMPEEMDVEWLLLHTDNMPELFVACGSEDFLIEENRGLHDFLIENEIVHEFVEAPGGHNWDFWNEILPGTIEWLVKK